MDAKLHPAVLQQRPVSDEVAIRTCFFIAKASRRFGCVGGQRSESFEERFPLDIYLRTCVNILNAGQGGEAELN